MDTYGTKTSKPCLLSLILLAPPIGVVVGYGITGVCISLGYSWRFSFLLQGASMAMSIIVMFLIPNKLLNIDEANKLKKEEKERII